jgi:hypothetical protein
MESRHWSIHVYFWIIFVSLIGGYNMIKQQIAIQSARIDRVNTRTDQLYNMFIDLVKEKIARE